jgi:photosystem II stability/assembly factor-like uncharacterized protein
MQVRSSNLCSRRAWLGFVVAAVTGASWSAAFAASDFDPLTRASQLSERAASALMTAVAPAGHRLVAVGERGIVLTSDDQGVTWQQQPSPVSVMLTNVRFATPSKGWAVGHGGVVLVTQDGGKSWRKQLDGVQAAVAVLKSAKDPSTTMTEESRKRAVADAEAMVSDGPDKPFLDLLVDDERRLTVVGAFGLALHSDDGGSTWKSWQGRIPNDKGSHLYGIRRSGQAIYISGEQGTVFRSADGGASFSSVETPYMGSFFGVASPAPEQAIVFGLRGTAYTTRDGGLHWTQSQVGTSASLTAGCTLQDGSLVLVSQAGNVLRSTDGGLTFAPIEVKAPVPFVGVTQATDGSLVMAGVRGMTRIPLSSTGGKP